MPETAPSPRLPVTGLIAASLFFTGAGYAATLNYGAIVGIDTLGIPSATYSLLLMTAALVGAAASLVLGYFSDKVRDRRLLAIGCALLGALGYGLNFALRSPLAFTVTLCVIMPFGGALYSQSFAFARSYYNARQPARAEFMNSILRTIFAVAWVIVPPIVGWFAATTSVFNTYGIAALAYLACAAIFLVLLRIPDARIGVTTTPAGHTRPATAAQPDRAILLGSLGVTLITIATGINIVTVPLLITSTLGASFGQLGIYAGLAAAMELPFMVLWGYALRRVGKHTLIVAAALLYALYMVLLSRAGSMSDIFWLQLLNGPATAALVSIPISYMQDAIKGRVGLSTSLLDVVRVVAGLGSSAIFGALTAAGPNYRLLILVAAGLSVAGAAVVFATHRFAGRTQTASATAR